MFRDTNDNQSDYWNPAEPEHADVGRVASDERHHRIDGPETRDQAYRHRGKHNLKPQERLEIMFAAMDDLSLTAADLRVFRQIVGCYNHHHGFSIPGGDFMARGAGISRPTVSASVMKLEAKGWIKVERTKTADGKNAVNRYRLVLDRVRKTRNGKDAPCRVPPKDRVGFHEETVSGFADTNPYQGNPDGLNPNQKNPFSAAAAQHEGVLFLDDDLLAMADEVRKEYAAQRIALPPDFMPADDVVQRHLSRGLTMDTITHALSVWRKRNAGAKRTEAEWHRTSAAWLDAWMANERKPARDDGQPLPLDWWPDEMLIAEVIEKMRLTRVEVSDQTMAFFYDRQGAPGYKGLSRDWTATWLGELQRYAARRMTSTPKRMAI